MTSPLKASFRMAKPTQLSNPVDVTKYAFQRNIPALAVELEESQPALSVEYEVHADNGTLMFSTFIWTEASKYFCESDPDHAATITAALV